MKLPDNNQLIRPQEQASFWKSHVISGLALFFAVNVLFWYAQPLSKVDPDSLPAAHTWTWWATREYLDQHQAPSVALLGSSLMMHPVSRQDADFLKRDLDYVHHHKSEYLSSLVSEKLGLRTASCFNFALPGSMISDDYIVAKALFRTDRKPKLLVLGLSLRDFIDSGVSCPAATPPFRYLKRFVDVSDVISIAMPQFWHRIDYYVGNAIYLWSKKLDTQVILAEAVKQTLSPKVSSFCVPSLIERADPTKNLPSNLRSEVEERMFIVRSHQPYSWEDNSAEYRKRYRIKHRDMFDIQTVFLGKLLDYCRSSDIPVLIVNMPLTEQNLALMPEGYYNRYLAMLERTAREKCCPFLNLNDRSTFTRADFYDTSHMNSAGGKKLLDQIAGAITANGQLAEALSVPATGLAHRPKESLQ
jgi:hypothetical protein